MMRPVTVVLPALTAAIAIAVTLSTTAGPTPSVLTNAASTKAAPTITVNVHPQRSGRCSPATGRSIKGSVVGQDGRGINATIGFDLVDAAGRKVDLATGCTLGNAYSTLFEINHYVGKDGAALGPARSGYGGGHAVSSKFVLEHLPANAAHIYAETYPRAYAGCSPLVYVGVNRATDSEILHGCAGPIDTSHYGPALRRFAPISATLTMVEPTTPAFGGSTGSMSITGAGLVRVYVRSDAPDGTRLMGWGLGSRRGSAFVVPALASGQTYTVVAAFAGGRGVTRGGVRVTKGKVTVVHL